MTLVIVPRAATMRAVERREEEPGQLDTPGNDARRTGPDSDGD